MKSDSIIIGLLVIVLALSVIHSMKISQTTSESYEFQSSYSPDNEVFEAIDTLADIDAGFTVSLFRSPAVLYSDLRPGRMTPKSRTGLFPPLVPLCSFGK